ncbi:MAG TPA: HlyC/CorC family transporter [candidate division Zixibacteria bacterium]|nr:HlyC/CorC family transporter [candidate division Zixibacteria bacterium]
MHNIYFEILAIILLIAANGFFSLSEFAVIASRKSRLKRMAKEGSRAAQRAVKLSTRPESFLATVQIGITFVGTLAGVFSGMTIVNSLSPLVARVPIDIVAGSSRTISLFVIVIIISFATVIIGELVPKYLAIARPEKIASRISGPMNVFIKIGSLPVKLLTGTAQLIIRIIGLKRSQSAAAITEDEINILIDEGRQKGVFDATEQELIHSVFDFTDTTARQAMTPRTDIVGIDINDNTEAVLKTLTSHGFSRYPVYDGSLDKIAGIIYTKDIIRVMQHSNLIIINDIIRKALFIPDSMKLNTLLRTFQQKRVHAAVVLDEYGGTAGLITLEDLLEEIVGEIHDEFDTDQQEFVKESENLAFVAGSLRVDELNDQFNTNFSEDEHDTLAGMIFETLGRPAKKGEEIVIGNVNFKVLEVSGNRLKRLRVQKLNGD